MRKFIIILSFITFISLQISLSGCGLGGTHTGNPTEGTPSSPNQTTTYAESILNYLCFELTQCYTDLTQTECISGILLTNNIDTELGLIENAYTSYADIIDDENSNSISVNTEYATQCIEDIQLLTCDDDIFINAYNINEPDNYSEIYQMIPTGFDSCEGVYE